MTIALLGCGSIGEMWQRRGRCRPPRHPETSGTRDVLLSAGAVPLGLALVWLFSLLLYRCGDGLGETPFHHWWSGYITRSAT